MKAMLAAAVLLLVRRYGVFAGGIHLGSGSGRIGIVYVRHGSLRGGGWQADVLYGQVCGAHVLGFYLR